MAGDPQARHASRLGTPPGRERELTTPPREELPQRPGRLLVLGAGAAQLGLLEAARKRGLYVIAVDRDPRAPGFRFADRRAIVSVEDEPAIDRLATAENLDGLIAPGIDFPVAIATRIALRLGLPHPLDPRTAVLATNKARQRECLAEAGVPHTRYKAVASLREAVQAAEQLGYPCVVKAPDRQGQKGLRRVDDPRGLADAYEAAHEAARNTLVLVEELVDGPEVTVNAFSAHGRLHPLTVTDRVVAAPPAFGVALAHVWPSGLSPRQVGEAVAVARAAAVAIGITDGPTYTQVLVGPDGARVGELAARLGGGHDAELCEAALGVDLNGLALSAALGEGIDDERLRPAALAGGACTRFLVPPEGSLLAVAGVDEAETVPGVLRLRVYREPGHVFGRFLRGADRAGAVQAVGRSREEAVERAEQAAELVRFETAPAEALV